MAQITNGRVNTRRDSLRRERRNPGLLPSRKLEGAILGKIFQRIVERRAKKARAARGEAA